MHPTNRRGPGQNPRHAHGQQTQPILIDDDDETYDIIRQPPRNHPPPRQQPITNFGYYDDGDQDMDDDEDEDEDEDDGDYTYTYYTHTQSPSNQHNNKLRTRAREDRHAALCILLDRELLMLQALSHNETLPQARRRFLSKMMAPQDNTDTGVIRAERYTIHVPGSNSGGGAGQYVTVPRGVVDVCETGDEGWGSKEGRSQPASPAASPFGKGKSRTPTRPRASTPGSANRRRSGAR
ncbi:uncharacterized protein ASPGLDRAFT_174754 [Aspergillus glaucus CBS 516.65]|uniref:Uncharacterized protein n=1 Tax=Aspergillus glaucus CBS 516.65 TaxID=1160497 RepID=A0A1L9VEK2_ASPGL|nr:hypothetical protein ASPGLDRAFT_174754 [Aspergillus glaucus CBS 516.65]OJJ82323.1 hypothetical protein ASPGLDRAFT_174754 [Aspergillus glaucus CBS 516.65]